MRVLRLFAQALSSNKMRQMRSITRYEPCNKPQTTHLQAAPCQSPPRSKTMTKCSATQQGRRSRPREERKSTSTGKQEAKMRQWRQTKKRRTPEKCDREKR